MSDTSVQIVQHDPSAPSVEPVLGEPVQVDEATTVTPHIPPAETPPVPAAETFSQPTLVEPASGLDPTPAIPESPSESFAVTTNPSEEDQA